MDFGRLVMYTNISMMQRPLWCWDMWQSGIPSVEALANYPEFGKGILEQASNLSDGLILQLSGRI